MSFILEALKKSDAERRRNQGPDLNALHAAAGNGKSLRRLWPLLLATALLLNGLCLLWWLRPWQQAEKTAVSEESQPLSPPATEKLPVATAASKPLPDPPAKESPPPHRLAPPGWNDLPAAKRPVARGLAHSPGTRTRGGKGRIPFLHDLPAEVRQQVPELAVSLHYYAADPASRMARINGVVLRQGETVTNSLTVEEITAETIVFRLGEIRFRVGEY